MKKLNVTIAKLVRVEYVAVADVPDDFDSWDDFKKDDYMNHLYNDPEFESKAEEDDESEEYGGANWEDASDDAEVTFPFDNEFRYGDE